MPRIAALSLLTVLATLALPAGAGAVYKCTNAEGTTYYSGQPCPKSASEEQLRVQRPQETDESAAKPAGKTLDEQIAAATDPVHKAQLELRKKECDLARTQLQRYEGAPYLVEQQQDGTQRRLSDEETAAEKQRLRDMIAGQCR